MNYALVDNWPELAWCAICKVGADEVRVLHGARVETRPDWFGEIVWAGDFADASFDQTDIVSGSGGRRRNGKLVFVSSGTIVDRLHITQAGDRYFVSNSLPCVLSVANTSLDPTYSNYYKDLRSIDFGLNHYQRKFKCSKGHVEFVYFDNLVWNGSGLAHHQKVFTKTKFADFDEYHAFLVGMMHSMAENIGSPQRQHRYEMLTTVSSGYDSATVAAITKTGGCERALTIAHSRSGDSDSGAEIGRYLGMDTHIADRDAWRESELAEIPFIAGGPGGGGSVYFKSAENQLPGTVLFTGLGGGLMWGEPARRQNGEYAPIGFSDASLTEYRLSVGFIHCAPPLWGMRAPADLFSISASDEMIPWRVSGNYNRPIARRIVEAAGVPREAFGMTKKAAAFMLHQPFSSQESLSPSSEQDFYSWLRQARWAWLRQWKIPPTRWVSGLTDLLLYGSIVGLRLMTKLAPNDRLRAVLSEKDRTLGHLARRPPGSIRRYTFPWAVSRMQEVYEAGRHCYEQEN
jgi:hypothetical protein